MREIIRPLSKWSNSGWKEPLKNDIGEELEKPCQMARFIRGAEASGT